MGGGLVCLLLGFVIVHIIMYGILINNNSQLLTKKAVKKRG